MCSCDLTLENWVESSRVAYNYICDTCRLDRQRAKYAERTGKMVPTEKCVECNKPVTEADVHPSIWKKNRKVCKVCVGARVKKNADKAREDFRKILEDRNRQEEEAMKALEITCNKCKKPITSEDVYPSQLRANGGGVCKTCFDLKRKTTHTVTVSAVQPCLCIHCAKPITEVDVYPSNWKKGHWVCRSCCQKKQILRRAKASRTLVLDLREQPECVVDSVIVAEFEKALGISGSERNIPEAKLVGPRSWYQCGCCGKEFVSNSQQHDLGRGIKACDKCYKNARCVDCQEQLDMTMPWALMKTGTKRFGFICIPCNTGRFNKAGITLKRADAFGVPLREFDSPFDNLVGTVPIRDPIFEVEVVSYPMKKELPDELL